MEVLTIGGTGIGWGQYPDIAGMYDYIDLADEFWRAMNESAARVETERFHARHRRNAQVMPTGTCYFRRSARATARAGLPKGNRKRDPGEVA